MTTRKPASRFRSGWCSATAVPASHARCRRDFTNGNGSTVSCTCICHTEPVAPPAETPPAPSPSRTPPGRLRQGSLFTGYAGLDAAVADALDTDTIWHCDNDPAAAAILAHHYPHVPNLGDITQVDWSTVEPVDVLTLGFPCQDVSAAGKRAGLRPGTRSGLWTHAAYAISQLRPRLVVIENVRGLLSAEAHSDMEPCPWCLGDGEGVTPLRALGAVLGDLAVLGYDARWVTVPASAVGAPHQRFRIFIAATDTRGEAGRPAPRLTIATAGPAPAGVRAAEPRRLGGAAADPDGGQPERRGGSGAVARQARADQGAGDQRERDGHAAGDGGAIVADPSSNGRHEGRPEPARIVGGPDAAQCGAVAAAYADGQGRVGQGTPGAELCGGDGSAVGRDDPPAAANAVHDGREGGTQLDGQAVPGQQHLQPGGHSDGLAMEVDWREYGPAIRRWEHILGRPAPCPHLPGPKGGRQLNPAFVEWMQGLPAGYITAVPGLSRNAMLRCLGNGVVPAQAALALRHLLADDQPAVEAS